RRPASASPIRSAPSTSSRHCAQVTVNDTAGEYPGARVRPLGFSPGFRGVALGRLLMPCPYDSRPMFGMGFGELLVVLVIVLVVFGPGRLPEMMGHLGKGLQEFKKGLREPPEVDAPAKNPTPPAEAKRET